MARMYSRKKGRSGSSRPAELKTPTWLKYKAKEVELLVVKYAKEGNTASQIGIILRDTYGIPDVKLVTKKSLMDILKEKSLTKDFPEDFLALLRKAILIRKHMEGNRQDQTAKRGLLLTESKIRRSAKYLKAQGVIAQDWKYSPEKVKIYVD